MITAERQQQYYQLIQELIGCPNGQEPEILDANLELIDADFIQTVIQVATMMTHENNPDGAKFLFHIARELAKQLGLYPEVS